MCTPPTGIQATKLTITDLKEGGEYQFRVCAINSEGVGEAANVHGTVVTSDRAEAPEIELDADLRKVVSVRAGGTLRLFVTIRGRPEPAVKWEKVEDTLTERAAIDTTSSYTMLVIDNVNRFDSGKYSLTLENSSGTKSAVVAVRILDTPSAPQKLAVKELKRDSVTLGWETPLTDGGSKITNYIVEKRESVRKVYTTVTSNCTANSFKIEDLPEGGIIPSYNTGPITAKDDVDPPRIMMDVKFRETLHVKAGETLKINADLVGRPAPVISWTKDGKEIELRARIQMISTDSNTCVIVKDCIRRDSGQYALTLQNIAGTVTMPINCVILDKPGPSAGPLQITGLTAEECTLSWGPPQEAGGADITHYVVERRETSRLAWTLVKGDVKKTHFKVTGLLKGNEYIFRTDAEYEFCVKAINKVGSSVRSPYSDAAAAMDRTSEPSFDVDIEMRKVLIVKHGTAFTLNVPFKGKPVPSVAWGKEGVDLKVRGTIEATESSTSLTIEKSNRNDSGEYHVTIESLLGKATLPIVVKVLDSPGPPVSVKVSAVTRDSATLTWEPPENDGGDAVKAYHVEKREASKKAWVSVTSNCHDLTYKVEDLQEGAIYYFRVIGENEYGVGEPQEAKAGTKITEVPSPPMKLGVVNVTKDSVTIAWTRPEYDGGSRVTGYLIDAVEKGQTKWVKCATVRTMNHTIKSLREGAEYFFRVRAENHAGLSEPKEMIVPVISPSSLRTPLVSDGGIESFPHQSSAFSSVFLFFLDFFYTWIAVVYLTLAFYLFLQ
uniref:Titin n=1 Tax=Acanthochromis polyacanthus TaxID=80966 RepID=A0A3Q1F7H9_9TELE